MVFEASLTNRTRLLGNALREEHWFRYTYGFVDERLSANLVFCCFFHSMVFDRQDWQATALAIHDQSHGCRDGSAGSTHTRSTTEHLVLKECGYRSSSDAVYFPRCFHDRISGNSLGVSVSAIDDGFRLWRC